MTNPCHKASWPHLVQQVDGGEHAGEDTEGQCPGAGAAALAAHTHVLLAALCRAFIE